jgi:hypothetical protein
MMPPFMDKYPHEQRTELIDDAAMNFCSQYSIWISNRLGPLLRGDTT